MRKSIESILATVLDQEMMKQLPPEVGRMMSDTLLRGISMVYDLFKASIEEYQKRAEESEKRNKELEEMVYRLLRRLNTNSTNSGIPPSQNPPGFDASAGKKEQGQAPEKEADKEEQQSEEQPSSEQATQKASKRKGHKGTRQRFVDTDDKRNLFPERCPCGCTEFSDFSPFYTHQHIELPPTIAHVIHFILHSTRCPRCGKVVKASLPQEFTSGYGPRLTALVAFLNSLMGSSRRAIEAFLKESGFIVTEHGEPIPISQGSIQKMLKRASEALKEHHEQIGEVARASPINYIDETSWPIFGPLGQGNNWLWIMLNESVTYFMVDDHRSSEAFKTLVGDWEGFLVSDDYGVYTSWDPEYRQRCLAHLLRAAKKLAEDPVPEIAQGGKRLYKELCRLTKMDADTLVRGEWQAWTMRMKGLLNKYMTQKDGLGTLAKRLNKAFDSLYTFLRIRGVEPTNNRAERGIRLAVVKRKSCFGSVSESGKLWIARSLSVLQTCRQNGWSFFELLQDALVRGFKGEAQDLSRYAVLKSNCLLERRKLGLS